MKISIETTQKSVSLPTWAMTCADAIWIWWY